MSSKKANEIFLCIMKSFR